ncbi:uncharacterized protein LOC134830683 [Culicoides brevitarsis]|uniref:uncharacterized protein LOC134830683 n=1 Tax=Culicoides brevitarsis TaxID=469753 RepID=UPI00307B14C9
MCSAMYGQIPEFYGEGDDWNVYFERLEQFFAVNDVPEAKQSAFLISVIGSYSYKILRDLCHPSLPKEKTFNELCQLLERQFSPKISIFRERSKFYNAKQEPHESISQWYVKVKKLSVDCRFGATLESVLLDKFVTGLRPGPILDRLCEENESVTLKEALEIAVNKESALAVELPPNPIECFECCMPPPDEVLSKKDENEENSEEKNEEIEAQNDDEAVLEENFTCEAPQPLPIKCKRIIVDEPRAKEPQIMEQEVPQMMCAPMASAPMPEEVRSRRVMRKAMQQEPVIELENVGEEPILYDDYVAAEEEKKKKARRGCRGGRKNKKRTENE